MLGPIWLNWPLAGLMAISALCHGGRLVLPREHAGTHRYDIDLTHLLTSGAMAAMLVMTLGVHLATAVAVLVGVPTLWFILSTLRALRAPTPEGTGAFIQPGKQVLTGAAMLFMLLVAGRPAAAPTGMAMAGVDMPGMTVGGQLSHGLASASSSLGVASLALVGGLALVATRHARQLRVAVATHPGVPRLAGPDLRRRASGLLLAPELSLGCQLAMSGTMIYLLVQMV